MKHCLLFIVAFFAISVHAQPGNNIVLDEGVWSTLDIHCLPTGTSYSSYHIKFEGDTVIDGLEYKIIWRSDDELQLTWNFYGAIREVEQQVFLRPPFYIEGMIYDFGVDVGDTIQATNYFLSSEGLNFVVTNIDSVLLLDRYRKRITVFDHDLFTEEVWIEGLGCTYGILSSSNIGYGVSCGLSEALCYEEAGQLVYQHPDYTECFYFDIVGLAEPAENRFHLYPNPASDRLVIELGNHEDKDGHKIVHIYSMDGRKVFEDTFTNNWHEINLLNFKRGVYIVRLMNSYTDFPSVKLFIE
jgi:hypothetical protein